MKIIFCLVLLFLLLPISTNATSLFQSQEEKEFRVLINPDGWELIGLKGSRVESRNPLANTDASVKSTIFWSDLRPKEKSILLERRAHYYPGQDGVLSVRHVAILTDHIVRYDVNGRAFCYLYLGGGVRIAFRERERIAIPIGCGGGVAYYDEDGDGIFERQEVLGGTFRFQLRIPQWVREHVPSLTPNTTRLERTRRK